MEKKEIKEKKNTKLYIVSILIVVLVLIVIGLLIALLGGEKRAERKLNSLAKTFYEYYYEENEDKNDKDKIIVFLSNYASSGLTIKLGDLETYLDTHKVENYKALKKCDKDKTKVTFYPVAPYGKKDYKIKTTLDCNF